MTNINHGETLRNGYLFQMENQRQAKIQIILKSNWMNQYILWKFILKIWVRCTYKSRNGSKTDESSTHTKKKKKTCIPNSPSSIGDSSGKLETGRMLHNLRDILKGLMLSLSGRVYQIAQMDSAFCCC